ncbi:MAG: helix-turn-helix domain-containing protein [Chloroflexota bacterium]|nr:helix-turn-helix domain-containing protein [Chloroflexota bacterium]
MPAQVNRLLTISQAAERLGVHQKTLRAWADKGLIAHVKTPTRYRLFDPADLDRLQQEMRVEAEGKIAA